MRELNLHYINNSSERGIQSNKFSFSLIAKIRKGYLILLFLGLFSIDLEFTFFLEFWFERGELAT